ncbi:MAG: head-tail adaptor protein [Firmicutes bacterium]|nr:head-tail adaptor protein [Bacillota bacterium]
MNLIEKFKVPCVRLIPTQNDDGEGGQMTMWMAETSEFGAAIAKNHSGEARKAEKEGATTQYTITTDKRTILKYGDVIRRVSDGKIFRITSNGDDVQTPECASFSFAQVNAEEWRLPL